VTKVLSGWRALLVALLISEVVVDGLEKREQLGEEISRAMSPRSRVATRIFVVAAISGVILVLGERTIDALLRPSDSWDSLKSTPLESVKTALILLFTLSATALIVGVVSSVAQIGAVSAGTNYRMFRRSECKQSPLVVMLTVLISGFVGLLALRYAFGELVAILSLEPGSVSPDLLKGILNSLGKLVVVASAVLAILVLFGSRLGLLINQQRRG
jgi:hypothetical protein